MAVSDNDDRLHRFLLERAGVRGVWVRLESSWRDVAARRDYPPHLAALLGQSLVASAMLTGHIKFDGALSLELKSAGALRLLFAEATDNGRLRGLARWREDVPAAEAPVALDALPQAVLAITIGSAVRGNRYQGLVELAAPDLATALEGYFRQSEQLPTRIMLAADGEQAVGLMLQRLPGAHGNDAEVDDESWSRVGHLTATLQRSELMTLSPEALLYRLYHEESVRLFDPQPLQFGCSCSRARVTQMLHSLGEDEVQAALDANDDVVEVTCEFCAETYCFDRVDAMRAVHDAHAVPEPSGTH